MKQAKQIGYRDFVDDTQRAVFEDDVGQFVLDNDGERCYGVWLVPSEERQPPTPHPLK
jgi:hypothetical protein